MLLCIFFSFCSKDDNLTENEELTTNLTGLESRGDGSQGDLSPTLSPNGYLVFASEESFESFQDDLFQLTKTEGIEQRKIIVDAYLESLGLGSFKSHYDVIHPYISSALLSGQLPEIPSEHYIGVLEPPFASSISQSGVVQVAAAFYIYKGDNQVIIGDVNSEYAHGFVNNLSNSIGEEVPVEEVLVTPGVYLDDPQMLSISPTGPSELCPNCPVVGPDGPVGPGVVYDDCEYVLTYIGGPCDPGHARLSLAVVEGDFSGWVIIDGDMSTQQQIAAESNEGPLDPSFDWVTFTNLDVGLHDIRVVGTFDCYDSNGTIGLVQIDETRTITIGTFCGAKRETITTGWDTYDDANNLYRTSFWSEIHYGAVKAKITATGFTARTINGDWLNVYSDFNFEQYSQWREDDSSCAERAFHNESDSYTGWFMASVRNSDWKDNRFWKSGEQWVTLETTGLNSERPGQGELIHHHLTCE